MDCTSGYDSFGCILASMGESLAQAFYAFGNPFVVITAFICITLVVVLIIRSGTNLI